LAVTGKHLILGASLGNCVHVAGILNFLKLAQSLGYKTIFQGPAVSVAKLSSAVKRHDPDIIAISYRLTPEVLKKLLVILRGDIQKHGWEKKTFVFGGTPPTADVARQSNLFEAVFGGTETIEKITSFLRGKAEKTKKDDIPPQNLIERIELKGAHPLLRHHFGLPTVKETVKGAKEIALSETVDILSIGPDQNAQESFFRPEEMEKGQDGAGGVPLRKPEDLESIYQATRCGNHPLLRCYSGTRDLIQWAEMCLKTINIAWGAVPLCWYNRLDGRSNRLPEESIRENQQAMNWYGNHGIPLEVNESHHWSLRDAPDTVAVAAAFLAAYNAKEAGVKRYVAQYMFNTPARISPRMDLAKILAKIELIESLHDENFTSIRQTRTGLACLSPHPDRAKGQLSASCVFQLSLEPKIIHVVGFSEGDHAATPSDIIESANITRGVIDNYSLGSPHMLADTEIQERKEQLAAEAKLLLKAIQNLPPHKKQDPWTDPKNLARAIRVGLLDAPHLAGNEHAAGKIITQIKNGACLAIDPDSGKPLSEKERISRIYAAAETSK
jgi:methylmalonyl-CoA mutase cobalamin-binding subunit